MAKASFEKQPAKARKKSRPAAQSVLGRSDNPMDWLYDNPLGTYPNFTFGILKQSYQGFRNRAVEFGGRKLRPVLVSGADGIAYPEAITAYRSGTVLPIDAPDAFDNASTLLEAMDRAACPHEAALLIYVTLSFPDARRMHHCWEEVRAFALDAFARARHLPACLIQHRPGDVGSENPAHLHLLVCPRRLDGTGFRGYATDLIRDEGQKMLHEEWLIFRQSWAAGGQAGAGQHVSRQ